jgi:hypothetical protein
LVSPYFSFTPDFGVRFGIRFDVLKFETQTVFLLVSNFGRSLPNFVELFRRPWPIPDDMNVLDGGFGRADIADA